MALPIQKFNRAILFLNRSVAFFTYTPKYILFSTSPTKLTTVSPNLIYLIGNEKWRFTQLPLTNRRFLSGLTVDEVRKQVDAISVKFTDAVENINDARSSMGTIYFTDDMKDAESLVAEVLNDYKTLLASLTDKQRTDVQRTIGLKMEELKAQISILKDSIKE